MNNFISNVIVKLNELEELDTFETLFKTDKCSLIAFIFEHNDLLEFRIHDPDLLSYNFGGNEITIQDFQTHELIIENCELKGFDTMVRIFKDGKSNEVFMVKTRFVNCVIRGKKSSRNVYYDNCIVIGENE